MDRVYHNVLCIPWQISQGIEMERRPGGYAPGDSLESVCLKTACHRLHIPVSLIPQWGPPLLLFHLDHLIQQVQLSFSELSVYFHCTELLTQTQSFPAGLWLRFLEHLKQSLVEASQYHGLCLLKYAECPSFLLP